MVSAKRAIYIAVADSSRLKVRKYTQHFQARELTMIVMGRASTRTPHAMAPVATSLPARSLISGTFDSKVEGRKGKSATVAGNKACSLAASNKKKVVETEEAVYRWIVQNRAASTAVIVKDIKAEALRLAEESERHDFKALGSWCKAFMNRKKLPNC
ncbi:hypothetical protein NECAME_14990 [Necator americanus]|uniref:HTH CENPB-type domain-containing protein n=1 Tax=Necator americanus TaxID=51031 RepID=W2SMK3_NECAM|nr:hypothetical protein NECAME_14990 [Necator americanus]ETN69947.1 hypothetical protein NECAME_14990 [Necator americanus]